MPELPEVERARRLVERALVGRRIRAVRTMDDPLVYDAVSPDAFARALRGRRVRAVRRRGKHLWLELDRRPWPLFHFGMTGSFRLYRREDERPRFWKLELHMDDGRRLALSDPRRFGRIRLQEDPERERPLHLLGFDPLLDRLDARALGERLRRRRAPIKAVLLDQAVFAGVGNWIADEVLFQARLRPDREAAELSRAEVGRLLRRLVSIVRRAVSVDADSDRFPRGWLFHQRWGRDASARTVSDEKIVHHRIGGRTTAWVPTRQR
jgi:formamidopyrimidine-DNA glycosylase